MSLYAQHGYGKSNKINKALEAEIISGVILSPKAERPDKLSEFIVNTKRSFSKTKILFDPQFYVCNFQGDLNVGKLVDYPYFEQGLTRTSLSIPSKLHDYTNKVIEFQHELGVTDIISPTIVVDDFNSRESQIAISMAYETVNIVEDGNSVYISFCINENAFRNKTGMDEFLNTISLFDVCGFYIIVERNNNTVKSTVIEPNILSNIMNFIYTLSTVNKYKVLMGYSDLISIPIASVSDADFACGWYSNLKTFSEANYRPTSGGRRPRKRYTSRNLMGAILLLPELSSLINTDIKEEILSGSPYDALLTPYIAEASWTDEISCMHNWYTLNSLLNDICKCGSVEEKLLWLEDKISYARNLYSKIDSILPLLDEKSNNSHLKVWSDAIYNFKQDTGV